jgi:hypothetical protein
MAEQNGGDPEKVMPLYQVQLEAARERARINADAALTSTERATALRQMELDQESARRQILGLPVEETIEQ